MKIASNRILAPLALTGLMLTGCGSGGSVKNLINNIQARSYTQNGDIYAEVSASLNTATYSLAAFALPIIDPNNSAINYGSISVAPNTTGDGGDLRIAVNVSQAAHINSNTDGTLPNGTAFPLAVGKNSLISIPIGNAGARIYLVVGPKTVLVGSAIPFSALNDVGKYVPGVNVFAPIQAGKVSAFVGVFAGSGANQTGLGVFADLSQVLPNGLSVGGSSPAMIASNSVEGVSSESSASLAAGSAPASSAPVSRITLKSRVSSRDEKKLYYHLWRVGQDNPTLRYK